MQITYYGHSCCGIKVDDQHILFDPFISPNPLAGHVDLNSIPADIIVCTHGHEDHVADVVPIHKRTNAVLVSNFEIVQWFSTQGINGGVGMNTGGTTSIGGLKIKCFQAVHSSTLPDGSSGGHPNGYIIQTSAGAFYHAGDTGLTVDMQLLKEMELRFAFLPIGDHFTMGIGDAVKAADLIGCDTIIGVHYDTFPPITIDKEKAKSTFTEAGKNLILMDIGESIEL